MIDKHYDVDKEHSFSDVLIIKLSKDIFLYCLNDLSDIKLKSTPLEFLARFRRVDLNGNLFLHKYLNKIKISKGFKIIIKNNGDIGVLDLNLNYFIFNNNPYELLIRDELPKDIFGLYDTYIHISFNNFIKYLDSFRAYSVTSSNSLIEYNLIMKYLEEEFYNE